MIEKGAQIVDSIVLPGARVGSGSVIKSSIVNEDAVVAEGSVIGGKEGTICVIGDGGEVAVSERQV